MLMIQKCCWLPALLLCGCLAFALSLPAADTNQAKPKSTEKKTVQGVWMEQRMKTMTKELDLTKDQQQKIKVLLDDEASRVTKLQEDPNLAILERRAKQKQVRDETFAKIKPLLTEAQRIKWDGSGNTKKKE